MARWTLPVQRKGQRRPAGLRPQFFLTDIVRPAAAALSDATAEHQHIDQTTVVHVHVIPVVHAGTDDDHRAATGFLCVFGKLTGNTDDVLARHAGDLLCPCRAVGVDLIVILRAVGIAQPTIQAVVGQGQIVDAGYQTFAAVG